MLEFALRYAALGWFIFPLHSIRFDKQCGCGDPKCTSPGKHPRIKWKEGATCDPARVAEYWTKWPNAGIGLACGPSGLLTADADGPKGVETFRGLLAGQPCPPTARARTARGEHVFFRRPRLADGWGEGKTRSDPETKLDTRGVGGFVVLAPSPHVSGHVYRWDVAPWDVAIAEAPAALIEYSRGGRGKKRGALGEGDARGRSTAPWTVSSTPTEAPRSGASADFTTRLGGCLVDWREVDRALARIPPDVRMDEWIRVGMALHAAGDDGHRWDQWSSRGQKYKGQEETGYKWTTFKQVPDGVGLGSLFVIAQGYGYKREEVMPLDHSQLGGTPRIETRPPSVGARSGAGYRREGPSEERSGFSDIGENTGPSLVSKEMNGHNVLDDPALALPESFNASPIRFPDVTEGGKVKATCANAIEAIRGLGITCERDAFHVRNKVNGIILNDWSGELSDDVVQVVRLLIRKQYGFDPGTQSTNDALIQECLVNSYHPINLYCDSLQWDGIPRLDTWMSRYLGAPDTPFNRSVSRLSLIAAVRRVKQPGCKFDNVIVLEGKEGKGKSSAIEILAGSENFSDQAILTLDDKAQQEAVQGVWLYEIADLVGHGKAEIEKVKAFASRTVDRARAAYARYRTDRPRTCIFFATTNDNAYLKSQTGNRRFWPVECGTIDLEGLRRDRDQLWAEAVAAERAGESIVLREALWSTAGEIQESRREHDPWEDLLENLIESEHCKEQAGLYRVRSIDVLQLVLGIPVAHQTSYNSKRLGYVLRSQGWDGPKPIKIEIGADTLTAKGYVRSVTVT